MTTPGTNVSITAPAATDCVDVVQKTKSLAAIYPEASTHLAVAPPVSVLALVASTALKYLDGMINTMVPPIGMTE